MLLEHGKVAALPIYYSPSGAKTYHFCKKKFYFNWLITATQAWKWAGSHPWRQVYELKQIKHRTTWAGDIYHQAIAHVLRTSLQGRHWNDSQACQLAVRLMQAQFAYSESRAFRGAIKSRAPKIEGLSTFLTLFEHMYDLPTDGLLDDVQAKIQQWIRTTFAWSGWNDLLQTMKHARQVYIEPDQITYNLTGAQIFVRMDLGIETYDDQFILYDWKCYGEDEQFDEWNLDQFRHQLLVYALWPTRRTTRPIPLERVTASVFQPTNGALVPITFTENDAADIEMVVQRWVTMQQQHFANVSDIDFDDLEGPYDPQRSCPWCAFKRVCGKEIAWHELR